MDSLELTPADKASRLRAQAENYALSGVEILRGYTPAELASLYNGIGPEWFPDELREAIDNLNPSLECCALIHDVRFATGDDSAKSFKAANDELRENGCKVADARYPQWYRFYPRWRLKAKARAFASLCQRFGWTAWVEGHQHKTVTHT